MKKTPESKVVRKPRAHLRAPDQAAQQNRADDAVPPPTVASPSSDEGPRRAGGEPWRTDSLPPKYVGIAHATYAEYTEEFTPSYLVDSIELALGGIDLDPASNLVGNQNVGALRYYSSSDNGFAQQWHGRVYLFPPSGYCDHLGQTIGETERMSALHVRPPEGVIRCSVAWWLKLVREYQAKRVTSAIFLGDLDILQHTQRMKALTPLDFPVCIPSDPLEFLELKGRDLVEASPSPRARIIVLLPPRDRTRDKVISSFLTSFQQFGATRWLGTWPPGRRTVIGEHCPNCHSLLGEDG